MIFRYLQFFLLMPLFLVLSGCFSNEPSEDEMREAFIESALPYVKKSLSGDGQDAYTKAFLKISTQGLRVNVRNFQKVYCNEINDITFNCQIYAEIQLIFPKDSFNIMTMWGGDGKTQWVETSEMVMFRKIKTPGIIKAKWKVQTYNGADTIDSVW